ncbi:MAG TPA: lipopolysaccharide assembly protein LapA domain-containing protein [Gaiellaceae bacterium]|nr:lipopolysaccharide assembly protein LapA domain-containing protein [Gaiellaceae bacterium]
MEDREQQFQRTWQPRLWITLAVLILIVAYLIAFVVGNDEQARVDFVFGSATTSLIWVILLSLLAGLLGGVLLSQLHRRRRDYRSEASTEMPSSISEGDA